MSSEISGRRSASAGFGSMSVDGCRLAVLSPEFVDFKAQIRDFKAQTKRDSIFISRIPATQLPTPSQDLRPLTGIFEEELTEQRDRRRAMAEELIVEALRGELGAFPRLPITPELEDHQLAKRIIEVPRIERAPDSFLAGGLFFVMAVLDKEASGVVHAHGLGVELDGAAEAAQTQQRFPGLGQAILRGLDLILTRNRR
jgi:hypothetical protein